METMYFDLTDFAPDGTFKRISDGLKLDNPPSVLKVPYITGTIDVPYSHTINDAGQKTKHVYKRDGRLAIIEE